MYVHIFIYSYEYIMYTENTVRKRCAPSIIYYGTRPHDLALTYYRTLHSSSTSYSSGSSTIISPSADMQRARATSFFASIVMGFGPVPVAEALGGSSSVRSMHSTGFDDCRDLRSGTPSSDRSHTAPVGDDSSARDGRPFLRQLGEGWQAITSPAPRWSPAYEYRAGPQPQPPSLPA